MTTNGFEDRTLRSYLLGNLAPGLREEVESRMMSDDQIFAHRLYQVEDELIDEHLRGIMNAEEKERLEEDKRIVEEQKPQIEIKEKLVRKDLIPAASGTGFFCYK